MSANRTDGLWSWDESSTTVQTTVPIDDIAVRPEWQVRERVLPWLVRDYVTTYLHGEGMPPIQLANVNGALILMDGAHRLAAQRHLKRESVDAFVTELSEDEARWRAALANTKNGARLRASEKRNVFDVYMAQGRYKQGRRFKSYREIARDMEGAASKSAIEKWMKKHYPKIAAKMAGGRDDVKGPQQQPKTAYETLTEQVQETLQQAAAEARGICPVARLALAEDLRAAARKIVGATPWAVVDLDDLQAADYSGDF